MGTFSQVSIYLSNVYTFYKIYVVWKEAIHTYLLNQKKNTVCLLMSGVRLLVITNN